MSSPSVLGACAVLALAALVACDEESIGPDPDADGAGASSATGPDAQGDGYVSGSRLKAKFIGGVDGAKQFTGFHDEEREEDCRFRTAADGKLRCLPDGSAADLYANATCTRPVVYTQGCEPLPYAYLHEGGTSGCEAEPARASVWTVGELVGSTASLPVFTTALGGCDPTTIADGLIFDLVAEIPADEFVEGTASVE